MRLTLTSCLALLMCAFVLGACGTNDGSDTTTGAATDTASVPTETNSGTSGSSDLPVINVDKPQPLDVVSGAITLSGNADVFEANVRYRLEDDQEKVVLQGFTTATCGSGCRGDFSKSIDIRKIKPGNYTFFVFEEGGEEGRVPFAVLIPLTVHASK